MKKVYSDPEITPLGLFTEETQHTKGWYHYYDEQSGNSDDDSDRMARANPSP